MNTEAFDEFLDFVDQVIRPSVADLTRLEDANRVHVQKLVYANLVDRFDATVDTVLLENCRNEQLVSLATQGMTQPVTEADLVKLLVSEGDLQSVMDGKLKFALRGSILRERHSRKLATLFRVLIPDEKYESNKPKVNISTGKILESMTPQHGAVPYSICGYADWLYSRRNSIVHGAGTTKLLKNDVEQLKKLYGCEPVETIKLKLESVNIAATFYESVVDLFPED